MGAILLMNFKSQKKITLGTLHLCICFHLKCTCFSMPFLLEVYKYKVFKHNLYQTYFLK